MKKFDFIYLLILLGASFLMGLFYKKQIDGYFIGLVLGCVSTFAYATAADKE